MTRLRILRHETSMSVLRQLALSVAATVIATGLLAGLQHEYAALHPAKAVPDMTSGGKFAARLEALATEVAGSATLVPPAPPIPLLAANLAVLSAEAPLLVSPMVDAPSGFAPAVAVTEAPLATKPARRLAPRPEVKRKATAVADLSPLPPKRAEFVAASTSVSISTPADGLVVAAATEASDLWTSTKGLAQHAVVLGGAVVDRIRPSALLP